MIVALRSTNSVALYSELGPSVVVVVVLPGGLFWGANVCRRASSDVEMHHAP
jgi:hypothetical protein